MNADELTKNTTEVVEDQKTISAGDDISTASKIQRQLAVLFFSFVFFGLIGAWGQLWWWPPLCVVAYFFIGLLVSRKARNTEKFADGVYYMGFLFTLWSLFIAFAPIGTTGDLSSEKIITQFGIALLTTVLGITFRLLLLQSQETFADQELEARESIAVGISRLNGELSEAVQGLVETRMSMNVESEKMLEGIRKRVIGGIEETSSNLLKHLGSYTSNIGAHTDSVANMSAEVKNLVSRLEIVSKESEKLAASQQSLIEGFREVGTGAAEMCIAFDDQRSKLLTDVERIRSGANNDYEAYRKLVTVSHLLAEAVEELNDNVKRFEGAMAESVHFVNELLGESLDGREHFEEESEPR
jgi:methyl-accepting chemotaxis protein